MGFFYMMEVHCRNTWIATALAEKYAGQTFTFSGAHDMWGGDVCKFRTGGGQFDGEWWASISPSGVTTSGIGSEQEASRANQFCNVMYGMLRNEKFFNFALADVECEAFRTLEELKEDLVAGYAQEHFDGLVVSKDLLAEVGNPDGFQDFSETHMWIPKEPERYSDQQS
ncbi:MAG: hypothetical protein GY854_28005 [Deltaproteobacteria bacterium]|nr:hypothetical protein [Deltaproteobacteria bacterium]